MTSSKRYDVVILGGGLAGLTLARQLRLARPATSILVAERRQHPVPESAHKVGESTVEMGSHYLSAVLGLEEHLESQQLRKMGLRFFFSAADNRDIARRAELGLTFYLENRTYQLDRGRFENVLARQEAGLGVQFLDACTVQNVSLGPEQHAVTLLRGDTLSTVAARWLVDASGRACLLKRKLGLEREVGHDVNAVWFRLSQAIDVDEWSEDPDWQARVPAGRRKLSTNHLMGRGYWVWLILLASGSISIGIVADPAVHPFEGINRFDRAMEWLHQHEPQCAWAIERQRESLQDFQVMRHYAHGCERLFSPDRWCITGDAGVFTDPFYSPGTDFIALSNTFITEAICRDLRGEPVKSYLEQADRILLRAWEQFLRLYDGQYPLMGNPEVMTAKAIWDIALYWAWPALLYIQDKFCDVKFMASVGSDLWHFFQLNARLQAFFREWDDLSPGQYSNAFVDYGTIDFLAKLHRGLTASLSDDELRARLSQNLELCEALAAAMFQRAARLLPGCVNGEAIDPYLITLKPQVGQVHGLFSASGESAEDAQVAAELDRVWSAFERKAGVPA